MLHSHALQIRLGHSGMKTTTNLKQFQTKKVTRLKSAKCLFTFPHHLVTSSLCVPFPLFRIFLLNLIICLYVENWAGSGGGRQLIISSLSLICTEYLELNLPKSSPWAILSVTNLLANAD